MPPIRKGDGTPVTPKGISQIRTGDGRILFDGPAIPDSGVFQDAILQWYAGEGINVDDGQATDGWNDILEELTATDEGSPTFREDQNGKEAVEYDGTDDGHDFDPTGFPTGNDPWSFAMVVYKRDISNRQQFFGWGDHGTTPQSWSLRFRDGELEMNLRGSGTEASYSNLNADEWVTMGASFAGGSNGDVKLFYNGSQVDSGTPENDPDIQDINHSFGYRGGNNDEYMDGFINEVLVSNNEEDSNAFDEFHDSRLGD